MFGLIGRIILPRVVLVVETGMRCKEGRMGCEHGSGAYRLLCGICPWREYLESCQLLPREWGGVGSGD